MLSHYFLHFFNDDICHGNSLARLHLINISQKGKGQMLTEFYGETARYFGPFCILELSKKYSIKLALAPSQYVRTNF